MEHGVPPLVVVFLRLGVRRPRNTEFAEPEQPITAVVGLWSAAVAVEPGANHHLLASSPANVALLLQPRERIEVP